MPRQVHTPIDAPGSYPTAGVALTQTAADASNLEEVKMTGRELLIAWNPDVAPHTVTIDSVANQQGRTKDVTADSIAAGATHIYGPFTERRGWAQGDGTLNFEADDALIEFSVIRMPT